MNFTYIGDFSQSGAAYPVINNALTAALERAGHTVHRNLHLDGDALTPIAIAHEYPPRPVNVKHALNICLAAWEFATPEGVPRAQIEAFNTFDAVFVPSQWVAEQLAPALNVPVRVIRWGVDTSVFYCKHFPMKDKSWTTEPVNLLWLGGTDPRHGFDVALQVLDRLPGYFWLTAKQSVHYPAQEAVHPHLKIIRDDLTPQELATLYNNHDIFLQTARGVGFSLPTLEALACGLKVVSPPLPPIQEFGSECIFFSEGGTWEPMLHHLYSDCWPLWFEPNVDSLVDAVLRASEKRAVYRNMEYYSWDSATKVLIEQVEGLQ